MRRNLIYGRINERFEYIIGEAFDELLEFALTDGHYQRIVYSEVEVADEYLWKFVLTS